MDDHECIIGILNGYDCSDLVTLYELKKHIQKSIEWNEMLEEDPSLRNASQLYKKWLSMRDYADKRKLTDLTRFGYCPVCGRKINWADIRRTTMTNQYIDRETAKRELLSGAVCMNHPEYLMKDDALHVIDSIPDADVVEVVRCKDCEYFRYNFENNPYCKRVDGLCDPGLNEFCSLGVRRDRND